MEDNTAPDKYRRVAHVEEFYEIIREVHEKDLLHAGYKKTFEKVWCCNKYCITSKRVLHETD